MKKLAVLILVTLLMSLATTALAEHKPIDPFGQVRVQSSKSLQ